MKIIIDNFQAISHAELEFPVGITTITGPNSSGKSSVLRALDFFTTNSGKKRHIKHGEKFFSVTIEHEGDVFTWKKTKTSGSFSKNDQTVEKIGTKTPHEFFEGFPLSLDDRGNTLQMSGEWEMLFPFDRTDSELFTLFENVFNVSDSSVILAAIKSDITKTKNSIEMSVNLYNKYVDIVDKIEAVGFDDVIKTTKNLSNNLKLLTESMPSSDEVSVCDKISSFIKVDLPDPKDIDLSPLIVYREFNDLKSVNKLISVYNVIDPVVKSRKDLGDMSVIEAYVSINDDLTRLNRLIDCESKINLQAVDIDMPDFQAREISEAVKACANLIEQFNGVKSEQEFLNVKLNELTDKLKEVKVCPLCESKLS